MKLRSSAMVIISMLAMAMGVVFMAPSASAHNERHPWGKCDQRTKLFNSNIRVAMDPNYPFPNNGTGGGVVNSYYNRLGDAIGEWNRALRTPEGSGVTKSFQYVGATNRPGSADVLIGYNAPIGMAGAAMVTTRPAVCAGIHPTNGRVQTPPIPGYSWVTIAVADKADWFTQEESERKKWENGCQDGQNYNSYSCSKKDDAGWAFVHELGHVMGFQDLNDAGLLGHLEDSGNPTPLEVLGLDGRNWARCGIQNARPKNTGEAATMCPTLTDYSTAGRTLAPYDFATLRLNIG